MMKKAIQFAAAVVLSFSLIGCSNNGQVAEDATAAETVSELITQTGTVSKTESATMPETETATEARQKNTIIGSVEDIDMSKITVLTDNGNEVILPIEKAELDFRNGFRVGNLVSIEYVGNVVQRDSAVGDVEVIRVADSADIHTIPAGAEAPAAEGPEADTEVEAKAEKESGSEKESESETKKESETESESQTASETAAETEAGVPVTELKGKIEEVAISGITVVTEEDAKLTFKIINTRMYFEKGMAKGTDVVVSYSGTLSGTDTENVDVALVCSEGAAVEVQPIQASARAEAEETEAQETQETEAAESETQQSEMQETQSESKTSDLAAEDGKEVKATERCNVRAEASTDSDIIAKLDGGKTAILIKKLDNGWSQVRVGDQTGYIKSEYLTED